MSRDTATESHLTLPLLIDDGQGRTQFRITRVQILNWGAYSGLQSMDVARTGTAIVGPSGRGKSTLLDAIASVILPNPQEFNQAARDDQGRKRERTVYSYARGQTDQRRDEQRRVATTNYLRPPGGPGFPSGAAITWATETCEQVTVFRLAWVGADVDGPEAMTAATIYGCVHDGFDLAALHGLAPVRHGASPLSKTSLERLVDLERGDLVDHSQPRVHAKMRATMSMGATDESQRLAMDLLRRAQASKGIFSINTLFTEFVLTVPRALSRWDLALEAYREASRLYEEFEAARRRTAALAPLPAAAEQFRAAGEQYLAKRALLQPEDGSQARIGIWHAERIAAWSEREVTQIRERIGAAETELASARELAASARRHQQETMEQLTAAGGDRSAAVQAQLARAQDQVNQRTTEREALADRLAEVDRVLPSSATEVTALVADLEARATRLEREFAALDEASGKAQAAYWQYKDQAAAQRDEMQQLRARRSMIPEDAETRRAQIAAELQIPEEHLRYAGELLQIPAAKREWEQALTGVLLPLASTLLVPAAEAERVRSYVYRTDMRGTLTFTAVTADLPVRTAEPESVAALLELADHPFAGWLSAELAETVNFRCVSDESGLDGSVPAWARGVLTPAGMRTGSRGRFVKDDRRFRYPWLGWDNQRLITALEAEQQGIERERQLAETVMTRAVAERDRAQRLIADLREIAAGLDWERIDDSGLAASVTDYTEQFARANAPENADLVALLHERQDLTVQATAREQRLRADLATLRERWGDLVTVQDAAHDQLDAAAPLTADERFALAELPFAEPTHAGAIPASLRTATADLSAQIDRHLHEREAYEATVLARLEAYRGLDARAARETDGSIDSLPAVLAIYEQLIADDLPRAKDAWLAKVDADMNQQLRSVLVYIEDDARTIRRGLGPINAVLTGVRFRVDSTLRIEAVPRSNPELREFTQVVRQYTSDADAAAQQRTPAEVERSFMRLRTHLALLDDQSRSGDAWRKRVFDAREHVEFHAIESRSDGVDVVHDGVAGMSGGEGQELIAFILGAALRFRLGEGQDGPPRYASVVLDEGFVKADSEFTGRALAALRALGFQVIVGAPREKATAFEGYVESVAYINSDPLDPSRVRIYPMSIREALELDAVA